RGGGKSFVGEHKSAHIPSAFLRLSHALQDCGHFIPAWIFPAALWAFHSAPHARSRAIMAWRPGAPVAGFAVVVAGAGVAARARLWFKPTERAYDAVASERHFLVKLVSAAPCSFCAVAWSLQHFLAKLDKAAPCKLLPVACTLQLSSANATVAKQNDANTSAIVLIVVSLFCLSMIFSENRYT